MALTVIGDGLSPYVRKVLVVLAEKRVDHEREPLVPIRVPPEYLRLHPLGKIPTLREGERALPDSSAICAYLERVHPEPPLYPKAAWDYGRTIWLEELADDGLAHALGIRFFEHVVKPRFLGGAPDEAAVERAERERAAPLLDYVERQLPESADFLVGGSLTLADVAMGSVLLNWQHGGGRLDPERWPRLERYRAGLHERPSFRARIEEDRKALAASP